MHRAFVIKKPEWEGYGVMFMWGNETAYRNFDTKEEADKEAKKINNWIDILNGIYRS